MPRLFRRAALLASLMGVAEGCKTVTGNAFGWALADQPSATAVYTPALPTQWSSAGAPVTVERTAVGSYLVRFPKLGNMHGGNAQITAYGADSTFCKTVGWIPFTPSGVPDEDVVGVYVRCFDGPSPVDTQFVVSYGADNPSSSAEAYAWSTPGDPLADLVSTPSSLFASNVLNFDYLHQVTLAIPSVTGFPMEHVTAVGPDPSHCGFLIGRVVCFDVEGNAVTEGFSYVTGLGRVPTSGLSAAYVVFDAAGTDSPVIPKAQGSSWGGSLTVQRLGSGTYQVTVPHAASALAGHALVHVTAYDLGYYQSEGTSEHCKVVHWYAPLGSEDVLVEVVCYAIHGVPTDFGFHMSLVVAPP